MSILDSITKPEGRPPIITICGDAGTGKTSLAATFPKPIFIRAEDGLHSVPEDRRPDAFPMLSSPADLFDQLKALLHEGHDYKTLVIDSVTKLETMFIQGVLASDPNAKSLNTALGGYGAGRSAVAAAHMRVRKAAGLLNERKGMNIIFVAHADIEKMTLPDAEDYSRWSLRLMGACLPPYVDDVDMVGFVRLVSVVRGNDGERKKAISTGDRELITYATAASVSKNRFGLTEAIDLPDGENPLLRLIPNIAGADSARSRRAARQDAPIEEPINEEKEA